MPRQLSNASLLDTRNRMTYMCSKNFRVGSGQVMWETQLDACEVPAILTWMKCRLKSDLSVLLLSELKQVFILSYHFFDLWHPPPCLLLRCIGYTLLRRSLQTVTSLLPYTDVTSYTVFHTINCYLGYD